MVKKSPPITFRIEDKPNSLSRLEHLVRISFSDKKLLKQAFTHRSYINENKAANLQNNERLEFLGDAVLQLVVTNHLYERFPKNQEGDLTNYRSALVSTAILSDIAQELKFNEYLFVSEGMKKDGQSYRHILADTLEAFIAAVYLDRGYSVAETFITSYILQRVHGIIERKLWLDHKSLLQEITQRDLKLLPVYIVVEESGLDHEKVFIVEVSVGDSLKMWGEGKSKSEAGKDAAFNLLKFKGWLK